MQSIVWDTQRIAFYSVIGALPLLLAWSLGSLAPHLFTRYTREKVATQSCGFA